MSVYTSWAHLCDLAEINFTSLQFGHVNSDSLWFSLFETSKNKCDAWMRSYLFWSNPASRRRSFSFIHSLFSDRHLDRQTPSLMFLWSPCYISAPDRSRFTAGAVTVSPTVRTPEDSFCAAERGSCRSCSCSSAPSSLSSTSLSTLMSFFVCL